MEAAATPLRSPRITVLANRVLVDGLAIDDPRWSSTSAPGSTRATIPRP